MCCDVLVKPSLTRAILSDPQFWLPLGILFLGVSLLAVLQ